MFEKGPIRAISSAAFMLIGCQACIVAFLVIYLVQDIGLELQWAGLIFGLAHGTSILARVYLGVLADRVILTKLILGYSGIVTGICFLILALFPAGGSYWLLCILGIILERQSWLVGLYFSEFVLAPEGRQLLPLQVAKFTLTFVIIPPLFTLYVEFIGSYATGLAIIGALGLAAGFRFLSIKY